MTYNVHDQLEYSAVAELIERHAPDVLCIQELTPRFERAFSKRLASHFPHRRFDAREGTWGIGIASKAPLLRSERFEQTPDRMPALLAELALGSDRLLVICVHLVPHFVDRSPGARARPARGASPHELERLPRLFFDALERRRQQAENLTRRIVSASGPLLVLGDFNEPERWPWPAVVQVRGERLASACRDADARACGATWPASGVRWRSETYSVPALFQVDHILGSGLHFRSASVLRSGGSDHHAIVAEFEFDRVE